MPPTDGSGIPRRLWIDTALPSPLDIIDWGSAPALNASHYRVEPRLVVVLFVPISGDGADSGTPFARS